MFATSAHFPSLSQVCRLPHQVFSRFAYNPSLTLLGTFPFFVPTVSFLFTYPSLYIRLQSLLSFLSLAFLMSIILTVTLSSLMKRPLTPLFFPILLYGFMTKHQAHMYLKNLQWGYVQIITIFGIPTNIWQNK